jgi:hypothetical protein
MTGGQYRENGNDVRIPDVPLEVMEYAQGVVNKTKYQPDLAWTIDICSSENQLKVLEIGSFSCAGLYACDCELIVDNINNT